MVVSLHDTVRIKDRDFRPPLYIEAEVIGVDYNLLTDESNHKFGNVVEYEENNLRDIFNKKLADISKKLNDNVSNINTIVNDVVSGQLEYYERKIFKQDTPPDNPVNDMLWYDTSNPNVAVLRRYWNGEWLNETVDDVEKIGGVTREKALYDSIKNAFENLSIQHAKLMDETYAVLNSEYLVDTDLKNKLQTELNNVDGIYQKINSDLGSITSDTATIGTLIDIQSQFSSYRQKLQNLYKAMRNAQISADKRLKLLQSQYTDEKFNDALNKVATKFGLTIDENNNMVGTPDVIEKAIQSSREDTEEQLKSYVKSIDYETDQNGIVQRLDSADSERLQLSNQISDKVSLSEYNKEKQDTDTKLTNMTTSITQNGQDIQQRATKEEFNASKKTLSKTISDFTNNVATGMTFTYDKDGAIQNMNIGQDGIKLKGDKVDITVNKDFNVTTQKLDNKVGKDEIVNRLNLSNEGLNIDVNKLGIRGGDDKTYLTIQNKRILSKGYFTRTWANVTDTSNLTVGIRDGYIMASNEDTGYNLYMTEKGLSTMMSGAGDETAGTLEFHSTKYNDRSRGVRLHSTYGAVALESDYSRIILNSNLTVNIESNSGSVYVRPMKDNRTGTNEFRFWVKNNDTRADTDGVLSYGLITGTNNSPYDFGSGIRFDKSPKTNYVYATDKDGNIGSGDFYARALLGDWFAKSSNLYACVDDKLRITNKLSYNNGNPNYRDLQCRDIQSNSIRLNDTNGKDFYIGVSSNELRVTNNLFWNGGDTGYKPVRASDFIKASSEKYKKEIQEWNYDALSVLSNELKLYSYKYKDDEKEVIHHGPVIGDNYDTPVEFILQDGVNTNEMLSWSLRAIQQLNEKVEKLEEQINER
ncbi:hypothetical protein [Staphylococcus pasteuri]|uniref:hypothetical protein n=1 Tax=Staphylococcus pasteuri TaxID=45972 RepID=UPI0003C08138|nr:hypothetical protein [Staphylococcus pasteuri]AGZ26283.1 phage minor structural protein [Staphylococcus pasteuri SP1]